MLLGVGRDGGVAMEKDTFGCVWHTTKLCSGKYLDLINPQPDQITLEDIARGLSHICRFGGQVPRFYSVAEHCLWARYRAAAENLPEGAMLACLFHDAAEAFIGDVVKPLKVMLTGYAEVEERLQEAIARKWRIDFARYADVVKRIDRKLLMAERRVFFGKDSVKWNGEDEVRRIPFQPRYWSPDDACSEFLCFARRLLKSQGVSVG